jgi:hypothetical protein
MNQQVLDRGLSGHFFKLMIKMRNIIITAGIAGQDHINGDLSP